MSTNDLKTSTVSTVSPNTPPKPTSTVKLNQWGNTRPLDKVQAELTPRKS